MDIFTRAYVHQKLLQLSAVNLASLFCFGTLDKSVRPTPQDVQMERSYVADYVESHPELRKDFYQALSEILPPEHWTRRGETRNGI